LASAFFALGTLGVDMLPGPALADFAPHSYYHYGTQVLSSVPLAIVSPVDGLEVGGLDLELVTTSLELRHQAALHDGYTAYRNTAEVLALHQGVYAAYATYRDARTNGSADAWRDKWRPWTADELIVAPVQPKNYRRIVLASLGAELALLGLVTGTYYWRGEATPRTAGRDIALGAALSLDAGVTEEALFRGFFYEELKLALSRLPAQIIDMAVFTGAHVPGEIQMGASEQEIVTGLAARALFAYLAEIAYDQGGLPESVTLHAVWDTLAFTTAALTGTHPLGATVGLPGSPPARSPVPAAGTVLVVPLLSGRF
jgi:hypothetical protein